MKASLLKNNGELPPLPLSPTLFPHYVVEPYPPHPRASESARRRRNDAASASSRSRSSSQARRLADRWASYSSSARAHLSAEALIHLARSLSPARKPPAVPPRPACTPTFREQAASSSSSPAVASPIGFCGLSKSDAERPGGRPGKAVSQRSRRTDTPWMPKAGKPETGEGRRLGIGEEGQVRGGTLQKDKSLK